MYKYLLRTLYINYYLEVVELSTSVFGKFVTLLYYLFPIIWKVNKTIKEVYNRGKQEDYLFRSNNK